MVQSIITCLTDPSFPINYLGRLMTKIKILWMVVPPYKSLCKHTVTTTTNKQYIQQLTILHKVIGIC